MDSSLILRFAKSFYGLNYAPDEVIRLAAELIRLNRSGNLTRVGIDVDLLAAFRAAVRACIANGDQRKE